MGPILSQQALNILDTNQNLPLGTIFYDPKDQMRTAYLYVKFGGTGTINPGLLLVAAAAPTNSTGLAISTTNTAAQLAAGSTVGTIIITNGATAVTQDQFKDGDIEIIGTGIPMRYRILGNSADSVGNAAITISFAGPLRNTSALVAGTNTVNLRQSKAYLPVASLTQALPVGVTIMPVPNTASLTYFGWVQIAGSAFVQATSATKGFPLVQDTSGTAGYFANTGSNLPQVAITKESASGSLASVFLQLN